ncbi:MAG: class I tRNA ligase family protein [candidate division KSB1 bacterium]|nr:class I tRNA ligase family protein [candidate division KSB1 bacterium]MDZ7288181.1 class I tRNA ligase family protein [candidate division KSB1 bacterium]MDZ7300306.1 class I tRNA ligase family protein [candidate division KSB1 bacterium]MDZ7308727.1 class I tRNA ligase family protein [candidate division KSB1 bacterium]MDZ7351306.1 class I tRNA ligase family protein [candidate division KSB1 bacterium]
MPERIVRQTVDEKRRALARMVRQWSVADFQRQLEQAGIYRAFVVYENGEFTLSHPQILAPVQAFFELSQDFSNHEAVFIGREDGIAMLFFAFVHDTRRGLAQGGLRFWRYDTLAEVLVDGLRLAQGMTRKNALAGLWWGGGKGIIPLPPDLRMPDDLPPGPARRRLFEAYGRFVASLGGVYYTAEDVGTKTADMDAILSQNRFTTCISTALGGSGNPSPFTAQGVLRGMQAAWRFLTGSDDLRGVRVAVQGAGNVGRPLIEMLDDLGAVVWVADVNQQAVQALKARRPRLHVVGPEEIFDLEADILAPCARGGVINAHTIPRLKVRLVCGAANNILLEERYDPERLWRRGITFVPDYVCNRMGITNCCDEWHGYLQDDIRIAAERVYPDTLRVLRHARNLFIPPTQAANELADVAASELHPILGHRGRRIIDHLLASNWSGAGRPRTHDTTRQIFDPPLDEPVRRVAWDKQGRFRGEQGRLAAAPISAVASPNLASFISPLLLDVRARAREMLTNQRPRRVLGTDHGGLALQLAIENSLPYEREEVGRPEFTAICRDFFNRNDAEIREQLQQLGIGFDPAGWLNPMSEAGRRAVERLFYSLKDAGLLVREKRWAYHCPRCQTVLVASDVSRARLKVDHHYSIRFRSKTGVLETKTHFPELVLGAVAVAVKASGPFGRFAGETASHPVSGAALPILGVDELAADAVFLVPAHNRNDEQIARLARLEERIVVFDEKGAVCIPGYEHLSLPEARRKVLEHIGAAATRIPGHEAIEAHRCRRCEAVVYQRCSEQLFVRVEAGAGHLRRGIETGAVHFSHPRWRERVLAHLDALEPWCISRQHWWGNEIPENPQEVFSTWFSLAAWSLQGAGWPAQPMPPPIEEVFVDPDLLLRWVVPSQIVAYAITGRPVFQHIHVHGSLQVSERVLLAVPGAAGDLPDEERFYFRRVHRPMRRSLGNVVQPRTLIRRFGADALRLGCLLCLESGFQEVVTASESKLRRGRKTVHLLLAKLTGLQQLLGDARPAGEARPADRWLIAQAETAAETVRKAYIVHHYAEAAVILSEMIEALGRYTNLVAARKQAGRDPGAAAATVAAVIACMATSFSPICPFLFEKVAAWSASHFAGAGPAPAVEPWMAELVRQIAQRRNDIDLLQTPLAKLADADRDELMKLTRGFLR